MRRLLTGAGALALLAGCTVGPDYAPPKTEVPRAFAEAILPKTDDPAKVDLAAWWKAYQDPELDRLVAIAIADGLDIKTAASRIRQARTQEVMARARDLPEIDATGNATHIQFSKNAGLSNLASLFGGGSSGSTGGSSASSGGIAVPGNGITTYAVGFDASWEIDLFGGGRRELEAARARSDAAVWNGRDAAVTLVAEVADDYLALRLAQHREAVARAEIARQTRSLELLGDTAHVGLVPEGDLIRQRAQLANAQASLEPLIVEQHVQMHDIAVLLARSPDAMMQELEVVRPDMPPPPVVPPGLPADLLRRRPDIRAAERNLAGATADIGVAVADLYPKIQLTAMPELISTALSTLFTGGSFQFTGTGAVNFPLLDFGRRRATVGSRREQAEQPYLDYQRTVLRALKDVEDALIRVATEQRRNTTLQAGVKDAERAVRAVRARYDTGLTGFTAVLDAQQSLLNQRDQLAQSDGMLRRNIVSLYKALGGGWQNVSLDRKPVRTTG